MLLQLQLAQANNILLVHNLPSSVVFLKLRRRSWRWHSCKRLQCRDFHIHDGRSFCQILYCERALIEKRAPKVPASNTLSAITRDVPDQADLQLIRSAGVLNFNSPMPFFFFLCLLLHHRLCFLWRTLMLGAGKAVEDFEAMTFALATDLYIGEAVSNGILKSTVLLSAVPTLPLNASRSCDDCRSKSGVICLHSR